MLSRTFITEKRDALVRERATLLARLNAAEGAINLCDVFLAEIAQVADPTRDATDVEPGGLSRLSTA
jgi:hypothetical protein